MKRLLYVGILSASALAACICWQSHRNSNVYSVHVYASGSIGGPQWILGSITNGIGFTEWTYVGWPYCHTNADGTLVWTVWRDEQEAKHPTSTMIVLGTRQFTIRAHAWLVGLGFAVMLALLGWLGIEARGTLMSRKANPA